MTPNNNLSILPFYTDISKQNHKKDYAFGEIYPLLTPHKQILPFQIIRPTSDKPVYEVGLWNKDGQVIANLTDEFYNSGLYIKRFESLGYDIIIYPSFLPITTYTPEGQYYLTLKDGNNTYYSDIFTVVRNVSNCLKIEYYTLENLYYKNGHVDFLNEFTEETMGGTPSNPLSVTNSTTACFLDNSAFLNRGLLKSIRVNLDNDGDFYLIHFREVTTNNWEEVGRYHVTGGTTGVNNIDLSSFGAEIKPLDTFGLLTDTANFRYDSNVDGSHFINVSETGGVYSFSSSDFPDLPSSPNNVSLDYTVTSELLNYPFKFRCYLPTQVGRPDYEFEEEVENRDGYQFIEKQISEKTFKFNFVAPEFLCDAMRIIRMMDYIQITSKGDTYDLDQFLITPKWEDGGYLASVEAEFQCDTVVKKIGKGYIPTENGDFNSDFNNDFNNQ